MGEGNVQTPVSGAVARRRRPPKLDAIKTEGKRLSKAVEVLKAVPLFSELNDEQLYRLANSLKRVHVKIDPGTGLFPDEYPGGVIIAQGDEGDTMFVVETGKLQARVDVMRSVNNPEGAPPPPPPLPPPLPPPPSPACQPHASSSPTPVAEILARISALSMSSAPPFPVNVLVYVSFECLSPLLCWVQVR
eukprot:COSAG01_NODE_2974_length_6772_cov_6.475948_3_plen_190_part_00